MVRRTGLWKTILFVAFVALSTYAVPASALITIEGGTSATFAWDPATGDVAGYYVFIEREGVLDPKVYSTVIGRNWETVTAEPNDTISVRVMAFDSAGAYGEPSSPSEPVRFESGGHTPPPIINGQPGDFDSDGVSDVIVQSENRGYLEVMSMGSGDSMLLMKCKQRANGTENCRPVKMNGRRWMIVGNGDYDGDGMTDILFRKHRKGVQQSSHLKAFLMDGDRVREIVKLSTEVCRQRNNGSVRCRYVKTRVKRGSNVVGSGDYNGDGLSDVLLHSPAENRFDVWSMLDGRTYEGEILPSDFGAAAEVIASGDFDGDGWSDIFWRDLTTGDVDIWGLTGDSTLGPLEGSGDPWKAIGAGDFDGDERDDVLLRENGTDRLAVRLSTTGTRDVIASARNQGARERRVPSMGDYDGDGLTDLVVYDGVADETELWLMEGASVSESELLPSPLDTWEFATADQRPPGSR